jgi:SAM-dependent methyltransferase
MTAGRSLQVAAQFYDGRRYLSLPRAITHWHQANEVAAMVPAGGRVLEIGPGSGHTTWMLRKWGYEVTSLDFDPAIVPSVVGDVMRLPFKPAVFDCVLAAEVLEHLPFEEFGRALIELRRVSGSSVIVTLPAPFVGVSALINLPRFSATELYVGAPYAVRHRFDGQHYWELGKLGYGLRRVKRLVRKSGLEIVRSFRPAPSLFCYFFVCTVGAQISGTDRDSVIERP